MDNVMVTGATGLIGSNVCRELLRRGFGVRALVREGSDGSALDALGAEVVGGDVVSFADVLRAAEGCRFCIHTAALVVGGPEHSIAEYHDVNVSGTFNVFDAARDVGMVRVVSFASGPNPRTTEFPLGAYADDPYQNAKLLIAREVIRRSSSGQDIVEISPAAAFGPAPTGCRAVVAPGFNSRIVLALRGELLVMPMFVTSFDLASEVADSTINALARGESGVRYDLGGRLDEAIDTVTFLNIACDRANVDWRVRAMSAEELENPESAARFGPSIMRLSKHYLASPGGAPDPSPERIAARDVLGHDPASTRLAVEQTVDWMLEKDLTV